MTSNVFSRGRKWYHRTEEEHEEGPFDSAYEAGTMLDEYAFHLDYGSSKAAHDFRSVLMDIEVVLRYGSEADRKEITEVASVLAGLLKPKE